MNKPNKTSNAFNDISFLKILISLIFLKMSNKILNIKQTTCVNIFCSLSNMLNDSVLDTEFISHKYSASKFPKNTAIYMLASKLWHFYES